MAATGLFLTMPLTEFEKKHINLIRGGIITGVVFDNLVAISLSYYLLDRGRNTLERCVCFSSLLSSAHSSRNSTQAMVQRLMVFSIGKPPVLLPTARWSNINSFRNWHCHVVSCYVSGRNHTEYSLLSVPKSNRYRCGNNRTSSLAL
jgi:hypothetical protein